MDITLKELFDNLPCKAIAKENTEITGISYNTKNIQPGDIFVCLKGAHVDGHNFIDEALRLKAKAIVVSHKKYLKKGVAGVVVEDTRKTLAEISAKFYGFPSRDLYLIGVTGTNGKTTTTTVIHDILSSSGIPSGLIGTMNWKVLDKTRKSVHTTPQAVELQSMLREMVDCGADNAVMEVSSHALSLDRVVGCGYDIVAYTNLTQDHLDFHKNMDDYLQAKLSFFTDKTLHKNDAIAVINNDDPFAEDFLTSFSGKKYTYGIDGGDFRAQDIEMSAFGTSFILKSPKGEQRIKLQLVGRFNVYNSLLAIAICSLCGIELKKIAKELGKIAPVDGRFELVNGKNDKDKPSVIVDYAHTPDGLEKILETAYNIAPDCVNLVFGCGGDRDRTKRPKMAQIAEKYTKNIIVTSDNPRSEDPASIIDEICSGFSPDGLKKVSKVVDRKDAILKAISKATKGDIVVLAGKGHEDYQIFANNTIHFDDREVAREALRDL